VLEFIIESGGSVSLEKEILWEAYGLDVCPTRNVLDGSGMTAVA